MARALGISQGTISGWVKTERIPAWRVASIVEAARKLPDPVELTAADFVDIPPCQPSQPCEAA